MATTTSPQLGSSNAIVPPDKNVQKSATNKHSFGLNTSDSKASLFEELLSLPLFDSKLPEILPTQPASRVLDSGTRDSSLKKSESVKEKKEEEDDSLTEASPSPALIQVLPNLPQVPDAKDSDDGSTRVSESAAKPYKNSKNDQPVADSVAPFRKINLDGDSVVKSTTEATNVINPSKITDDKSTSADADFNANSNLIDSSADFANAELISRTGTETVSDARSITETIADRKISLDKKSKTDSINPLAPKEEDLASKIGSLSASSQQAGVAPEQVWELKQQDLGDQKNVLGTEKGAEPESTRRSERLDEARREFRFAENQDNAKDSRDESTGSGDNSSNTSELQANVTTADVLQKSFSDDIAAGFDSGIDNSPLSGLTVAGAIPSTIRPSIIETVAPLSVAANARLATPINQAPAAGGASAIGVVTATSATTSSSSFSNTTSSSSSSSNPGYTGLSKYQEQRVLHRTLKGIEQAQVGTEPIRVRLHPPELGSLQVTIRVERSEVTAAIEVESIGARQVLLDNLPKLQASLKEQGISIADFRVDVVAPGDFSSATSNGFSQPQGQFRDGAWSAPKSRYTEIAKNRIGEPLVGSGTSSVSTAWSRRDGNLDVNV